MKKALKTTLAVSAIALLAACEGEVAGENITANFGAASTTNALVMTGRAVADAQARFRSAAPDMVNFAFNSAQLDDQARQILAQQAAFIRSNPSVGFRVYGHTDLVGSNAYNRRLGLRRAQAAVAYLISQGVPRGQLQAVSSFGETRPLVATQNRERLNRRTVTEVFGITANGRPFLFDGKVADRIYNGYVAGGAAAQ